MKSITIQHAPIVAVLFTLTIGTVTTTAAADSQFNIPPSVTVSYADLDLAKAAGAERLYSRISRAARSVCQFNPKDLRQAISGRACMSTAINKAVADVNKPLLTAHHMRLNGGSTSSLVTASNN